MRGHDLFVSMNCAGCHGYTAAGGMGPDITDKYWRYGGTPVLIFKSISEGRPQGMPAWSPALPADDIWKLVSYIEALGGTYAARDYYAALQGDRAGDNIAPELPPVRSAGPPARSNEMTSAPRAPTPGDRK